MTPPFLRKERVMTDSPSDEKAVETAIREAIAETMETDALADMVVPDTRDMDERLNLEKLVDEDFPFDESQLEALNGITNHVTVEGGKGACLTGAAGTGKTTCEKKLIDMLMETVSIQAIDMETYFKSKDPVEGDEDDDYEVTQRWVPSVALCAYTGRASQMIKKNFPRSWWGNIMTIHRLLGFMPEWYEEYDEELGDMRNKMRFVPTYNADNKLPWDIIGIDEAGMLGLELWEQLRAALKDTCIIIMIGDINQLPPVHGRSVFGFAMGKWPSWELTHVHRQEGKDNPIVDNAWRVLKGQMPVSGGAFQMVKMDGLPGKASAQVQKFIPLIQSQGIYDPIRDTTITAINGHDPSSRGYALGQIPLNSRFALIFNKSDDRYVIDAGRERPRFAVGDKVMATRNDWQAGITNGMTGVIESITENGAWAGDRRMFGRLTDVAAYMAAEGDDLDDDPDDVDLADMLDSQLAQDKGKADAKEKRERGPASHIVTVRFGGEEHGFDVSFATLAEVGSLATAYVVTCHKMQGGECPVVVIICHDSHKSMLYREWLYTAITRASGRCILLYTEMALRTALSKQKIKGSTLAAKVEAFNRLVSENGPLGPAMRVNLHWGTGSHNPPVPSPSRALDALRDYEEDEGAAPSNLPAVVEEVKEKAELPESYKPNPLAALRAKQEQQKTQHLKPELHVHVHHHHLHAENVHVSESKPEADDTVDGGELKAEPVRDHKAEYNARLDKALAELNRKPMQNIGGPRYSEQHALPAPSNIGIPQHGAVRMMHTIEDAQRTLLLPAPVAKPNPLALILAKKRGA